ncbi:MAG: DJ-1/PfpI family protein [Candidatus Obscuribacterales bacterium]|nr:DJ-1/PfpI family protein [Candidatus Obscuribacterales bacterium]
MRDLDNADDLVWKSIDGDDINNGVLDEVDALVVPGGSALKQAQSMGADARQRVTRFVDRGGIYMGICAGAYLSSQAKDNDLGLLPLKTLDQQHWFRTANGTPVDVELTPLGMEVFGRRTANVQILYENGPIFGPPTERPDSSFAPLGYYRSEVVADGGKRGVMLGAPAMVFSRYGLGLVLAISPHPEKTPGLHEMELNALRWLYQHKTNITQHSTPSVSRPVSINTATTNGSDRPDATVAQSISKPIRVALFIDRGTEASEFTKEFQRNSDDIITYRKIDGQAIRDGALKDFDALVIPGGSASTESYAMGPEAREEVKRFIRDGGLYLGVCAGAYLVSSLKDCYLGILPLKTLDEKHWYRTDGSPLVDVELTTKAQEILGIKEKSVKIVYENGPIFAPPFEKPDDSFAPLAFFRSEVVADGGETGVMIGAPAMIYSKYGRGEVLVISPHPEETPGMKEAELHAIRWLFEHRNSARSSALADESKEKNTPPESPPSTQPEQKLSLSERALHLAESIFSNARDVAYEHHEVRASRQIAAAPDGALVAHTDCSGFISYIVESVAPKHYAVVREREPGASYPQAKIWASFFDTLNSNTATDGWLGISDWRNLRPGDFIAWKEGSDAARNTGHVMMVLHQPGSIQELNGYRYIEIPVIDSSSVYHFPPERLPPNANQTRRNGVGEGCIRLILSASDQPIGYWAGTYWGEGDEPVTRPSFSKLIRFARMVSLLQ